MAEEMKQKQNNITDEEVDITKDRGVLDFLHGKKADHKDTTHESNDNAKQEQHKKHNLLDKLHRSNSSSSSSSEEEIEVDGVKQKRKKNKKKEEETADPNQENKGLLDKIKEKLPGQHKKTDHHEDEGISADTNNNEKKGILEKIKEKLPGYHAHSKPAEEHNETQKQNDTSAAHH